jgi:hypothetical protein
LEQHVLYTRDTITGGHLVIDGDVTLRCPTRADTPVLANQRYAAYCAKFAKQTRNWPSHN